MTDRITIPVCKYILMCLVQGKKNDSPIELSVWPRTMWFLLAPTAPSPTYWYFFKYMDRFQIWI